MVIIKRVDERRPEPEMPAAHALLQVWYSGYGKDCQPNWCITLQKVSHRAWTGPRASLPWDTSPYHSRSLPRPHRAQCGAGCSHWALALAGSRRSVLWTPPLPCNHLPRLPRLSVDGQARGLRWTRLSPPFLPPCCSGPNVHPFAA